MRLPFRKRATEPASESRTFDWPSPQLDRADVVSPTSAMQIADVFACVRCLSDAAASVPLHVYRRTSGGRERLTSGRAVELLDRPAPATTQANIVGQVVTHLALHGNAYLGKFRDADGRVEQLALLHPESVAVKLVDGAPQYTLSGPHGQSTHGVEDITHVRAISTDGLVGLSPIQQCRVALRVADGAGRFIDSYLANGARPSGIVSLKGHAPGEQMNFIREMFAGRHSGASKMHKIAVFDGDVEWKPIAPTLGDVEFVEQRKMSTAEIARIFRIPSWMIGAPSGDSLTYSNVEQQQLAFVTHSLRPWLVLIEQAITNDPDLCRGPNVYAEFVLDALLRADHKTRAEVYTAALNPATGWMTREEVRRAENLPAEPNTKALSAPEGKVA
ncbi:MAG: phage portal protein [Actinomycetota bacterium]|nr:phage portal protein [Actinomycetota bacterium]